MWEDHWLKRQGTWFWPWLRHQLLHGLGSSSAFLGLSRGQSSGESGNLCRLSPSGTPVLFLSCPGLLEGVALPWSTTYSHGNSLKTPDQR